MEGEGSSTVRGDSERREATDGEKRPGEAERSDTPEREEGVGG